MGLSGAAEEALRGGGDLVLELEVWRVERAAAERTLRIDCCLPGRPGGRARLGKPTDMGVGLSALKLA